MVLLHILRLALVSALLFISVSGHCTTPKVRKEWRRISSDERAAWINAIKVFLLLASVLPPFSTLQLQCLTKLPHNPKIVPVVDRALSLIPPLNPNSSYFDGGEFLA